MYDKKVLSNVVFHLDDEGKFDSLIMNYQVQIFDSNDNEIASSSRSESFELSSMTGDQSDRAARAYELMKELAGL